MAYRFKIEEPLRDGFRRIAREQIGHVRRQLQDDTDEHTGIHEARKALKRLRALLRLVRPAIGEHAFAREDRCLRAIGRRLAGARDVSAMLESLALLERRARGTGHNRIVGALRSSLEQRRAALDSEVGEHAGATALPVLRKVHRRLGLIAVEGTGFEIVHGGLARCYGEGRRGLSGAFASGQSEDLHEFRKRVQQHWRHMQLLTHAWPEVLEARVSAARELSEILGQDHDLALLVALLADEGRRLGSRAATKDLAHLCARRQHELRSMAWPRAQRLFVEREDRFARRIRRYWRAARHLEPFEPGDAPAHS